MNRLPARMLPHRGKVAYEAKLGEGTYGPRFAEQITPERAALDEKQKLVRTADGQQVMSSARIALDPEHSMPLGSRVTLHPGTDHERVTHVIVAAEADWPKLPRFFEYALE
mgnify:CR=1 FL=1